MSNQHCAGRQRAQCLWARTLILMHVMVLASLMACAPSDSGATRQLDKPSGRPQKGLATMELRSGTVVITVELAVSPSEQETGLMHRTELQDGHGMLFVYPDDRRLSFWMKNTLIPLSIAYLDAQGVIRELYDMQPQSLAPVESERHVRYALETPQGWFERVGLKPGDRFDLSALPGPK